MIFPADIVKPHEARCEPGFLFFVDSGLSAERLPEPHRMNVDLDTGETTIPDFQAPVSDHFEKNAYAGHCGDV